MVQPGETDCGNAGFFTASGPQASNKRKGGAANSKLKISRLELT